MKKLFTRRDIITRSLIRVREDELYLNSFFLMATTALMALFGFTFWLVAARLYSSEQVGIASTLVAATNFITYAALLGFNTTFIRYLPTSHNRSKYIDTGLILVMSAGFIVALSYALVAPHYIPRLHVLTDHWYFVIGFAFLVASYSANLVTDSIYVALRATKYKLLYNGLIAGILQLVLVFLLVNMQEFGIFASYGIAGFVTTLLSIMMLVYKFKYKPRFLIDSKTLKEVIRYSSSNYLANMLNILPTMLLPLIIINKLGASSAGYFYMAFMMGTLLFTIAYAVSQSMFAEGSYNNTELKTLLKKSSKIVLSVMLPASLIMASLGPLVLELYGKEYADGARSTIMILAATGPFVAIYILGSTLMRITKQTKALITTNALYVVTICGLTYSWVGKGLAWVALAWLLGHVLSSTVILIYFNINKKLLGS